MEEVLGKDADGVSVYLDRTIPGKVGIQVGIHNQQGQGIRRKRAMTASETRILAYSLLKAAEEKGSN